MTNLDGVGAPAIMDRRLRPDPGSFLRPPPPSIRLAFIRSKRVIAGAEGRDVACGAPNCTWRAMTGGSEEFNASVPLAFLYPELNQT